MSERRRIWSTQAVVFENEQVRNPVLFVRYALRALARELWPVRVNAISFAFILLVVWNILWPAILTTWELLQVDIDLAIASSCDRPYAQAFCRESCKLGGIQTTFPISCSGRRSDIPYPSKEVPSSSSSKSSKSSGLTILDRLEGHKESCEKYQDVVFPSIKDDLQTTAAYRTRPLDTYKKLCRSLDHMPMESMSYYLQVMVNATTISKYARDAQNYTQETLAYLSRSDLILATKEIQKYFSEAIPSEGDAVASLKRVRGRIQSQFEKLVNRLVEKRLSTRVAELFSKAELQEMQPLLMWMREDARRIHEVARRSKVMRGWKQRPESGRVMEILREGEHEGRLGKRLAPWS